MNLQRVRAHTHFQKNACLLFIYGTTKPDLRLEKFCSLRHRAYKQTYFLENIVNQSMLLK